MNGNPDFSNIVKEKQRKERNKKIIPVIVLAALVLAVMLFVFLYLIPQNNRKKAYNYANELYQSGEYSLAIEEYKKLGDYLDSAEKRKEIIAGAEYKQTKIKEAKEGETVFLGVFEQDCDYDEKEKIEWIVLKKQEDKALLISRYVIDCRVYNSENRNATWASCELRDWLNGNFYTSSFTSEEKRLILTTEIAPGETSPDDEVTSYDKIFLLSLKELEEYFPTAEERKCYPTEYAKAKGVTTNLSWNADNLHDCWWWLRDCNTKHYTPIVVLAGTILYDGMYYNKDGIGVRPAMWVSLGELEE